MRGKFQSGFMGLFVAIFLFAMLFVGSSPGHATERFCVVADMVPILERLDTTYKIEHGSLFGGEDVLGMAVYGNHVEVKTLEGARSKGDWAELLDPDGGGALGFVEKKGLVALPAYEALPAEPYVVRVDAPDLRLLPGVKGEGYRLAKWDFALIRGEIVTAYGSLVEAGEKWLLLGFSTSIEDDGPSDGAGSGGVGRRYAWLRAAELVPLAGYVPNYEENDDAWVPAGMRVPPDSERSDEKKNRAAISGEVRKRLVRDGFAIAREPAFVKHEHGVVDDMADLYNTTGAYTVDFITTDIFLHAHHLIFSRMLQKLEHEVFAPRLAASLSDALTVLGGAAIPGGMYDSSTVARDMLSVPLFLLGRLDEKKLSERAHVEVGRILKADARDRSTITGTREDYTQYRPRGHYAGIPALERYFRAMNFLGNAGLALFDDDGKPRLENVATAALLVLALDATGDVWDGFDAPINFLIGTPDDGAFQAYRNAVHKHVGSIADIGKLENEQVLAALAAGMQKTIPDPLLRDRETGNISREAEARTRLPEFRLSGKRFTFDAYIMNQLTSPRVGSNTAPRNLPEGTDVMAVLGSEAANRFAARNNDVDGYAMGLAKLRDETDLFLFGLADTAYVRWLRVLEAALKKSASKQAFYRSSSWQWKKLATVSASWAELKHDTVLYAKQSGAEMGGGGEWYPGEFEPPLPRGYVEPEPQVFKGMIAALDRLSFFLETFALETVDDDEYTQKIAAFRALCVMAHRVAEKEVCDEALSAADYADIKSLARAFTSQLLLPGGIDVAYDDLEKLRMPLVTDVATDFMDERVLHVGTGVPRAIYVFVNDRAGGPRIAKGWTFSYYEFVRPLSKGRMTDAEWRKLVYDETRADELAALHPAWYGALDPQ